jgi:hypothetical protein
MLRQKLGLGKIGDYQLETKPSLVSSLHSPVSLLLLLTLLLCACQFAQEPLPTLVPIAVVPIQVENDSVNSLPPTYTPLPATAVPSITPSPLPAGTRLPTETPLPIPTITPYTPPPTATRTPTATPDRGPPTANPVNKAIHQ